MDRRTFIKSGLLAGAVAAAGAAVGCAPGASGASESAAEEALAATGDAWYGEPAPLDSFDLVDTEECELLICGCGAGGIVATATAAEEGIHAITIDKGASHGSIKTYVGVVGSRIDEQYGVAPSKMDVMNEPTRYTNGFCNPRVARTWIEEGGATFDWIADIVADRGANPFYETDVGSGFHGVWPVYPIQHGFLCDYTEEQMAEAMEKAGDSGDPAAMKQALPGVSNYLMDYAIEKGADVRYLTELVQLMQDESGAVTGAIVKDSEGYKQINASKGVILATGGYEADPGLLAELNPQSACIGGVSMAQMGNDGLGIKAGIWAGGVKDAIPTLMTFSRAAIAPDAPLGDPYQGNSCWMGDQPFLRVNMRGERICCESSPYDYPLFVATYSPQNKVATIWDANYKDHIASFHTLGCSRIVPSESTLPDGRPNGEGLTFEANDMMIAQGIEMGIIQQADTLEELAEKLLMPADALKATVVRYNELCEAGEDTDFGKEPNALLPLTTPPLTGAYFGGHVLCTIDGLKIDEHGRVLTAEQEPIAGLYAVGNCSGSLYAGSYPELLIGNANGRTVTFGRHAVKHAAGLL
ncbi:MAG: FAD-binding protein [Adlercreutzia sp.]|uniref:FAD-binding protein n=1 Tax=uncultured Adlercreutzia sp. TaxID=875803 RepID=UPI00216C8E15|nr:FAD-binding protein [uncultured Adlercreutzia sp.]MCI8424203.1 FAD-binding protein [Adlercreutzia sp.]